MTRFRSNVAAVMVGGAVLSFGATLSLPAFAQSDAPAQGAPGGHMTPIERFRAANTTHDGHLTLEQAQAAGLTPVVRHFSEIDTQNKGYITIQDIRTYRERTKDAKGGGGAGMD